MDVGGVRPAGQQPEVEQEQSERAAAAAPEQQQAAPAVTRGSDGLAGRAALTAQAAEQAGASAPAAGQAAWQSPGLEPLQHLEAIDAMDARVMLPHADGEITRPNVWTLDIRPLLERYDAAPDDAKPSIHALSRELEAHLEKEMPDLVGLHLAGALIESTFARHAVLTDAIQGAGSEAAQAALATVGRSLGIGGTLLGVVTGGRSREGAAEALAALSPREAVWVADQLRHESPGAAARMADDARIGEAIGNQAAALGQELGLGEEVSRSLGFHLVVNLLRAGSPFG